MIGLSNTMKTIQNTLAGLAFSALTLTANAKLQVATEGAEVGKWTQDFEAAKALAAEKKLPVLVNFTGSDWCHWCKIMDENVFVGEAWKEYAAENAVLVTIDFPKDKSIVPEKFVDRNNELKSQFGVRGFPTYIILDSDATTQIGQLGAGKDKTPASFVEEFKAATKMSAGAIEEYIKANPDKAEAYKAAIAEDKAAMKELEAWIETKPERNDENNAKFEAFQARIKAAREKLAEF